MRAREVLEHLPLDPANRLAPLRLAAGAAAADVLFGDPPLRPRAGDRREVDAELFRQPPHERRRANLLWGLAPRSGARPRFRFRLRPVPADDDEHGSDGNDLAFGDENLRHHAAGGRRDLDRRLVGRDLDERVVLRDLLALLHEPARDLALGEALAEVGQLELVGHG